MTKKKDVYKSLRLVMHVWCLEVNTRIVNNTRYGNMKPIIIHYIYFCSVSNFQPFVLVIFIMRLRMKSYPWCIQNFRIKNMKECRNENQQKYRQQTNKPVKDDRVKNLPEILRTTFIPKYLYTQNPITLSYLCIP